VRKFVLVAVVVCLALGFGRRGSCAETLVDAEGAPLGAGANPSPARILSIQFINRAQDIPGIWDEKIRSQFIEAMTIAANNVTTYWRKGRPVIISSDIRSRWRLIVVDHPLSYGGIPAAGFHAYDGLGPYAIFTLADQGVAAPFMLGSHELGEMLADPNINRFLSGWFVEIADPAVCCHYDVTLSDGSTQPLSDFVLPSWFFPHRAGPYDFIDSPYIQQPLETGPGGFKQR
jgi:hypothetical protein